MIAALRDPDAYGGVYQRRSEAQRIDVWNEVPLVPQLTGMSCWAAAAAMIVGWRESIVVDPAEVATGAGRWEDYREGLRPSDVETLAKTWQLVIEPPAALTVERLTQLLTRVGPLWVGEASPGLHAIVVTGIQGDGTPEGTFVRVNDPWPIGRGERYRLTFRALSEQFRAAADAVGEHAQLLHSGGRRGSASGAYHFQERSSVTMVTGGVDEEQAMTSTYAGARAGGNGHDLTHAFNALPASELYTSSTVLASDPLARHGGTGENLFLGWNDTAAGIGSVDVVMHLHGYDEAGPSRATLERMVARAGLGLQGRSRPTLVIVPRGRKITSEEVEVERAAGSTASPNRYTFPGLIDGRGLGLEQLVGHVLDWWGQSHLGLTSETPLAVDRLVFTAHAEGGTALNKLLRLHAERRVCNPDEVLLFDAVQGAPGRQADGVVAWARGRGQAAVLRCLYTARHERSAGWIAEQVAGPGVRVEPVPEPTETVASVHGPTLLQDASAGVGSDAKVGQAQRVGARYGTPLGLFGAYRSSEAPDPDAYDTALPFVPPPGRAPQSSLLARGFGGGAPAWVGAGSWVVAAIAVGKLIDRMTGAPGTAGHPSWSSQWANAVHEYTNGRTPPDSTYQDYEAHCMTFTDTSNPVNPFASDKAANFRVRWRANGQDIRDCRVEMDQGAGMEADDLSVHFQLTNASSIEDKAKDDVARLRIIVQNGVFDPIGEGSAMFRMRIVVDARGNVQNEEFRIINGDPDDFNVYEHAADSAMANIVTPYLGRPGGWWMSQD